MLRAIYILGCVSLLGLLIVEAPAGGLLTGEPESGRVGRSPTERRRGGSGVRGPHPTFIYLGGGYHGGK